MKSFITTIITTFLLFFGVFFSVSAQIPNGQNNLTILLNPKIPAPNEEVRVDVESFATDLDRADIRWTVDGVVRQEGMGAKSIRITAGSAGEATRIVVTVDTQEGDQLQQDMTLRPVGLDIIWEADSYTPPFYKGKALLTAKNTITLTAIPQFSTNGTTVIDPKKLVYTWKQSQRTLRQSGFGKQSITITGPQLFQGTSIEVEVSSFDNSLRGRKTTFIRADEPEILFYEKHPLLGIQYNRAMVGTVTLSDEEVTYHAEPFFFSQEDVGGGLEFEWSLNRKSFAPHDVPNEVTFRQTEGSGTARIDLEIINVNKLLQGASGRFFLEFGGGGFFGGGSPFGG